MLVIFVGGQIFEILHRDGLGRIGKLTTAHGKVTTPTLMPVIDPSNVIMTPTEIRQEVGAELMMTNAYLIKKRYGGEAVENGVHGILGYNGPIMTDSGGYQILRYGSVETSPEDIVRYQDAISPDIATILDVPTGAHTTRKKAEETVQITTERAREAIRLRSNQRVMWCGPVQGGLFCDLVAKSAREIGKLDYHIHAIGSPVELLEEYRYAELVDLVMTAKQNLPLSRPIHLFGAGHPMMLALAVAMGCDLFDSAAYVLYAREGRYLTPEGTFHLEKLSYFPCECPVCVKNSPEKVRELSEEKRVRFLATHNLHVTFGELRRIRESIIEGKLWEHVQVRCRSHPLLLEGFRRLLRYSSFIERFDPVTKKSAFYYSGGESAMRPEVLRHSRRLEERYSPPPLPVLAILPAFDRERPKLPEPERTHLVRVIPPFGAIPEELDEVYPLGQLQVPKELDPEQIRTAAESIRHFLQLHGTHYERVLLFNDGKRWGDMLIKACASVAEKLEIIEL
ncbi:MAG: tRNA guanosine(15) transglycosylase TgtA [Hadesarchaea archaeon]|nr:MAG: tRNA guanosine(15) transglycosylase TgtA [Hadesarchaea archaeon]